MSSFLVTHAINLRACGKQRISQSDVLYEITMKFLKYILTYYNCYI